MDAAPLVHAPPATVGDVAAALGLRIPDPATATGRPPGEPGPGVVIPARSARLLGGGETVRSIHAAGWSSRPG